METAGAESKKALRIEQLLQIAWFEAVGVAGLVLIGLVLRVRELTRFGLNSEELHNYLLAQKESFSSLVNDLTPPLFPLLAKPFLFLGVEWGPRLFSVIAGCVFCLLLWWLVRRGFGKGPAMLALFFAVTSPQLTWLSRQGQGHQLFITLIALLVLLDLALKDNPTPRLAVAYTLVVAASLYCSYSAVFPLVFFLGLGVRHARTDRKAGRAVILGAWAGIGLFLPKAIALAFQAGQVRTLEIASAWEAGPGAFFVRCVALFVGFSPAAGLNHLGHLTGVRVISGLVLALITSALVGLGLIGAIRANRDRPTAAGLIGLVFITMAGLLLSYWIIRFPIADHDFAIATLATIPLTACACLLARKTTTIVMLVVLITGTNMVALKHLPLSGVEENRGAVQWIEQRAHPQALVLAVPDALVDAFDVYGKRELNAVGLSEVLGGQTWQANREDVVRARDKVAFQNRVARQNEVFLVTSSAPHGLADRGLGQINNWLNEAGFSLRGLWSGQGVAVSRFRSQAPAAP